MNSHLLAVLGGCLLLALIHTSEACSCLPAHPQTKICWANLVIKVEILLGPVDVGFEKWYLVQIEKIYKDDTGNSYAVNDLVVIKTGSSSAACGVTWMQPGETYLLSAYESAGGIYINSCGFNRKWQDLGSHKKLIAKYVKNCFCQIQRCVNCKDQFCGLGAPGCKYYAEINGNYCAGKCYEKYGICEPIKKCKACAWKKTKALSKCLTSCGVVNRFCPLPIKATDLVAAKAPKEFLDYKRRLDAIAAPNDLATPQ